MSGGTTSRKGSAAAPHGSPPAAHPAADPALARIAEELATYEGRMLLLAEKYRELDGALDREELQAKLAQIRIIKAGGEETHNHVLEKQVEELKERCDRLESLVTQGAGGVGRASSAPAFRVPEGSSTSPA